MTQHLRITVVYKDSLVIRFNITFKNLKSFLHKFVDSRLTFYRNIVLNIFAQVIDNNLLYRNMKKLELF